MSTKLPKHIAQMVEKNNLVMAIKTLSEEQGIGMGEAKVIIDEHEQKLKQQQDKNVAAISAKQNKKQPMAVSKTTSQFNTAANQKIKDNPKLQALNSGLDNHLQHLGYKKPLLPYWAKRLLVILLIVVLLSLIFWQIVPKDNTPF